MKNRWLTYISGRVLVEVKGQGVERFMNRLVQSGLLIWKARRQKTGAYLFYITLKDVHKLRGVARKTDHSISFIRGEGLPFIWKRALNNSGFMIGIILFFLIAAVLSNVTWGIHINGADPKTEHEIRKELTQLGIKVGSLHFLGAKPDVIQKNLTDKLDNITWVGVELRGTTYHFQVVQKTEPEPQITRNTGHLVAKKRAVITDMFVEKGKPLVKINQFVEKGQILVSGSIGNEEEEAVNIAATGEIWGLTWYHSQVEFPLNSTFQVYSGEEVRKYSVKLGKYSLPIWGFNKVKYKQYETEVENHELFFLGWKLPLTYTEEIIRENEEMQRSLTKKEAVDAAKALAKKDLEKTIPADARLDKEIILQEDVENGKVKLSINYQVIENIAEEKPIMQGD